MKNESERWSRIDEVFAAALSLDARERQGYVARACGADVALREEVEALLASATAAESLIGDSADAMFAPSGPLVDAPDATLQEGAVVGPYRILRLVGRGGMGHVYAAVRADATMTREVALKVVRAGPSTPALVRRLRREQRILGSLEHPGIARLYDAGMGDDGVPFLAMELVSGTPLDWHIRDGKLGINEVLAIFDQICDAVAYAHERLVVHRDLKPANVLVDATGRVRLLDFGIAALIADDEAVEALTRPGQLILTPEYASPEQTRGEPARAAMDVYSLGVLLYETLTGVRPDWQRMVMTQQSVAAIEGAMKAPSERMRDATRARAVRGDLDQVVLSALSPDPARRYATVAALREDLRNVREGYAIRARRPGFGERTWRAVRRNPMLASAWATAFVLALTFATSVLVQNRRITRERDVATSALASAEASRDRAVTTSRVLATLFESADPWSPTGGTPITLQQVLDRGVARVDFELVSQPAARAVLLTAIGRAYTGLARYDDAQRALDSAFDIQGRETLATPDERAATLTALGVLASARGRTTQAESLHSAALRLRQDTLPLNADPRGVPAVQAPDRSIAIALVNVGASHMSARRFDSARVYIDSGIAVLRAQAPLDSTALAEVLNNRATLAQQNNDFPLAARLVKEAVDINRIKLGREHPRVAGDLANLAFLLDRTEQRAEAESLVREAIRIFDDRVPPDHPTARNARLLLGNILSRTGRLDEAARLIGDVVRVERTLPDAQAGFSITLDNLAGVQEKQGLLRDALVTYREALSVVRTTAGPGNPGVAIMQGKVADMTCRVEAPSEEVFALFEESRAGLERAFPPSHPFRVGGRGTRAMCLLRANRRSEGEPELSAAFDVARGGPAQLYAMARRFGEELMAHYTRVGESERAALVRSQLNSIPAIPPK